MYDLYVAPILKTVTKLLLVLVAASLILSGCTTMAGMGLIRKHAQLTDYNPQNFQGCTIGEYIRPYAAATEDSEEVKALTVRWWDCKNKATVSGGVDLNGDGTPDFTYSASDVVGSNAAQIRADVEKAFSDNSVEVIPVVVESIIEALKPGFK